MPHIIFRYRRTFVIAFQLLAWAAAWTGALFLRFDFDVPPPLVKLLVWWVPLICGVRLALFSSLGLLRGFWRYTGIRELRGIIVATTLSSVLFLGITVLPHGLRPPLSVLLIDWLLCIVITGGARLFFRLLKELSLTQKLQSEAIKGEPRRVIIVGAGDAGERLIRDLETTRGDAVVIGFVDDHLAKIGEQIRGAKVIGTTHEIAELAERHRVHEALIAIPSATGEQMRRVIEQCQSAGLKIQTLPAKGRFSSAPPVRQLRGVNIEDLLKRAPVHLDMADIAHLITQRAVFVTGAGGSIGSELCRQILAMRPHKLILIERSENALFALHHELSEQRDQSTQLVPALCDINDKKGLSALFSLFRPSAVFHAAAHKHVPMMELHPFEAFKNNVFGTKSLAELAHKFKVDHFVQISTDKAVNPRSYMGVSKRIAEIFIQALSQYSQTHFVCVRFGNVLGSTGSVVPLFQRQIGQGGPVTITHPDMTRYFMTVSEACELVLQAATVGRPGEILVLDMGHPVKIVDLARDLITLSGLEPGKDIEIRFTGIRPGEKMAEDLAATGEKLAQTRHEKIFVSHHPFMAWSDVQIALDLLKISIEQGDVAQLLAAVSLLVPEAKLSRTPMLESPSSPQLSTPHPLEIPPQANNTRLN